MLISLAQMDCMLIWIKHVFTTALQSVGELMLTLHHKHRTATDMADFEIRYCDIPSYLYAGEFYRNLDSDDPEGIIQIPADCFHPDGISAADLEEFRQLLRVMSFWVLDDIPVGILDYCKQHEVDSWDKSLADLPVDVEAEVEPLLLTAYSKPTIVPLYDIIKTSRWDLIVHAVARLDKSESATVPAALCGNLSLLKYLHEEGFVWSEDTCAAASQSGHLDCLQYVHENGCPWDVSVYQLAAANGHLSCMQYAFEQGLEWHVEVCPYASGNGCIECLQFAYENGCPWDAEVYVQAAVGGHLLCMQYAFEQGLEWHASVCREAAMNGHLECLQFAHENGCPWDNQTTDCAAQEGHVDCLLYALEHGCLVHETACYFACKHGHVECVQLLHQLGVPWNEVAPAYAAECTNIDCLQYLHENGCPWDENTTTQAAFQGHIEPLRYALERGCPHSDAVVQSAVHSNNMECMQYLIQEQMLFMDESVFKVAFLRGDLRCVKYLINHGCPYLGTQFSGGEEAWEIMDGVFQTGNPEFVLCVEYAVEHGWTPDENFIQYIVTRNETCDQWLQKEGYYTIDDVFCSEMNYFPPDIVDSTLEPQQKGNKLMYINVASVLLFVVAAMIFR